MVKIGINIDGQDVQLKFPSLGKYNLNSALLLKVCIDAIRAHGIEITEEFIEDFLSLKGPNEVEEEGRG